jgi:hypothetical protein
MSASPAATTRPSRLTSVFQLLLRLLQGTIGLGGFILAGSLLGAVSHRSGFGPLPTILLIFALGFLATAVHECGHWLGARWGRMTVLYVRIFALELQLLQNGSRLRWSRRPKGQRIGGYVIAVHTPNQPWRSAQLRLVAMGPLTNLLFAAACALLAALLYPAATSLTAYLLAFAAINLGIGLANLVPTARHYHSDGAQLLAWWGKPDVAGPEYAYPRLLALSTAGVAAADLPPADLEWLDRQPMPAPLISLFYRLYACQAAGDWAGAVALGAHMETLIEASPAQKATFASSIAIMRAELAFCRAMHERDARALAAPVHNPDIDWYVPTLAPRCRALSAALAGEADTVERELDVAAQFARNSRDQSLYPLHVAVAGHIRALL